MTSSTEQQALPLPCPFCGGEGKLKTGYHMLVDAKIGCDDCYAEGPVFGTDAKDGDYSGEAIAAWNKRTCTPTTLATVTPPRDLRTQLGEA